MFKLRYKESVLDDLLSIFGGDVELIKSFLSHINFLRDEPLPDGCEKIAEDKYKVKVEHSESKTLWVVYEVDENRKIVTIFGIIKE